MYSLVKQSGDLSLEFGDAEVMSAAISVIDGLTAEYATLERNGRDPSPEDYIRMVREAEFQLDHGLNLLSMSARSRLSHVIEDIRLGLTEMSAGHINAIEMGRRMSETIGYVEQHAGGISDGIHYTPYEWARLCRTESAMARFSVERETLSKDFDAVSDAIDGAEASLPIHPNCMCSLTPIPGGDGRTYMVIQTTPAACELCSGTADDVLTRSGL